MHRRKGIPLVGQRYIFIGQNNSIYTNGHTYEVVTTDYHWIKEYGFCIFMTTDKYPDTKDMDYCCATDPSYFKTNFWKV